MAECECCHSTWDVEQAECGHWFCWLCRSREHDEPCDGSAGHTRPIEAPA